MGRLPGAGRDDPLRPFTRRQVLAKRHGRVLGMEGALDIMDASYVQPAQGQQILPGVFLLNDATDWYAQALHQHHLATYLGLLTGTQVDTTALPQPSVTHAAKARLVKRIGSLETALARLADR